MNLATRTKLIKDEALRLGFSHCGISKAEFLEEEAPLLEQWLSKNRHGKMQYMENHFDKRLDPRLLVEGTKSVVSLLLNYFPDTQQKGELKISKYAYGNDYHFVIKEKLAQLKNFIQENIGEVNGRAFVDSAPVLDKAWAKRGGLGWIGKHSNLINKGTGSFFFIAELLLDLDLEYDAPIQDYCGTCTKCMDACPTQAIVNAYEVDASKCISYLTIELKENIPNEFSGKTDDWIFGCDVCQDVCPWNRFAAPHQEKQFEPNREWMNFSKSDWQDITQEIFTQVFKTSALQRTGIEGLKRNIEFALKKNSNP